jgi:hypothetical protein
MSKDDRSALIELITREQQKRDIRSELFDKQLALIDDPAQYKAAHPGRRAGKSEAIPRSAALLALDAGFNEIVIVAAETAKKAKALHWANLHALVLRRGLDLTPNLQDGSWATSWGAKILFWGLNDQGSVELLRGFKLRGALFDEIQFYANKLPRLISNVLEPALGDTGGPCMLFGTPSVTRIGHWADICLGRTPGWSVHHWDVRDNVMFPRDVASMLQQVLLRNNWTWDNPVFQREWLGQFVNDTNMQVYQYVQERNSEECLPVAVERGFTTLGIDYGTTEDACAWVVVWSPKGSRAVYVLEAQQHHKMLPDDAADITRTLIERWRPQKIVGDGGGLGAPYVRVFNRKYGHLMDRWVQPADKRGKLGQIAIVNGELGSGRIKVLPAAQVLADEWTLLPWKDGEREEVDPAYDNHLSDAARYAIFAHMTDIPELERPPLTAAELAEQAFKERQRRARERAESTSFFDE